MRPLEAIRYEEQGDVARIRLVRPRINTQVITELGAICDHLEDESQCKAVVLQGAGEDFCLGIDFADFKPGAVLDIHGFNKWEKLCVRLERLPKVTVAAVSGRATGGGAQLVLLCDARIAAPDAVLCFDEVKLGFLPGMATFRLAKYIGVGAAKRLVLRCPEVRAEEAARLGIVDEVSPDLESAIGATIDAFRPIHPVAVELGRRLLNESYATSFEDAIGNFLAAQHRAISQAGFLHTIEKERGRK